MIEQKDLIKLYNLPEKVEFCKNCTISNQRPRITFDEKGVCSACNYAEYKRNNIDWEKREKELEILCDKHRSKDGRYDVIVPCSGGKDGSFVAHQLKHKYGMNPLTVTWSPNSFTEIGFKNLRSFIEVGGFSNIMGSADGIVNKKLANLSFIHLGDPFQPFIYGQTNFPLQIAVKYNIQLIMYGENGEVEYGGNMKNAYTPTREISDHNNHYFSGMPPSFWYEKGLTTQDLLPYMAPPYELIKKNNTEIHFMGYYKFWDPQENFYYCTKHTGFSANTERTQGTYSKYASLDDKLDGMHYYLAYVKFGIGRTTSDAAHEIRDGKIDREEGIALIRKYDAEFPSKYYEFFKEYCNIDDDIFNSVIDSWRSPHLWEKRNNEWVLKHTVF